MKKEKLFQRDFSMVVVGQIISLFGNGIIRFALPLYLLNETKSSTLFGIVSACALIPMILLSPVGGIIADRVNKRNIMVILDFSTAALMFGFMLLRGHVDIVGLIAVTLVLLYGIAGAYQPAVQASLPALAKEENLMAANAVINQVSALANLIGPAAGGALYAIWGIIPIIWIGAGCFLASAIMEIFIHIPFEKRASAQSVWQIVHMDIRESANFMRYEQPLILKTTLIVAGFNLFLSAYIMIALPVVVTQRLGFAEEMANQLYGYAQAALAVGSLLGGVLSGVLSRRLQVQRAHRLLVGAAVCMLPMCAALLPGLPVMAAYFLLVSSCIVMMAFASMFTIVMMTYLQAITPQHLVGKVISCVMCLCMCAQPLGQAMYGWLFDMMADFLPVLGLIVAAVSLLIALLGKRVCRQMSLVEKEEEPGEAPLTEAPAEI
ncbi:MAG: MFS transporter [Oscillospiraceae bacterium]|nr:MFS transporter [Oscillospiraceae bacterium]